MPIKAVLFDFDGVLIDSLPCMKIAWKAVQEEYSIKQSFNQFSLHIGRPFFDILSRIDINSEIHMDIFKTYNKVASQNYSLVTLNKYVNDLFCWLITNNYLTGLVTSKDQARTNQLVDIFNLKFDTIITPELTLKGKPSPEPILLASSKLQLKPNETLFIGDMASDMKCAFKAGSKYLHYKNGYQKELNQFYGGSIDSLLEIIEYLGSNSV